MQPTTTNSYLVNKLLVDNHSNHDSSSQSSESTPTSSNIHSSTTNPSTSDPFSPSTSMSSSPSTPVIPVPDMEAGAVNKHILLRKQVPSRPNGTTSPSNWSTVTNCGSVSASTSAGTDGYGSSGEASMDTDMNDSERDNSGRTMLESGVLDNGTDGKFHVSNASDGGDRTLKEKVKDATAGKLINSVKFR